MNLYFEMLLMIFEIVVGIAIITNTCIQARWFYLDKIKNKDA